MGNKHSVNPCGKETKGSFNHTSSTSPNESTEQESRPSKFTMALSKASVRDMENIGLRREIAENIFQEKAKGKLQSLSDVVAALEKSKARCYVKFEDNFKVKIDEKGEIELLVREEDHERKLMKKEKGHWKALSSCDLDEKEDEKGSNSEDKEDEVKPLAKKRKGLEKKVKRNKRRKAMEDEDWDVGDEWEDDEELEEEKCEENQDRTNVNTASEEKLEALQGIGPSLARKIVQYRNEYGDFHQLEDLSAVRGISKRLVKELSEMLTVGQVEEESGLRSKLNPVPSNGCLQYEGREVIRVMSWNLQCFSDEKVENEGVLEVICQNILQNGISIAVFQEIGDETALLRIQDELNRPTLKSIKDLKRPKSYWECITSDVAGPMFRSREFNGFLFDSSRNIELKSHDLLEKPREGKKQFSRRPFLGFFKAKGFDFVVVSVHLKATGLANEDIGRLQNELAHIPDIVSAVKEQIPGEKDMVIVGDFNLEPDEKEFDSFREAGMSNLIPHTSFTNISSSNLYGSKCYDNIWIGNHTMEHYSTGYSGVLRDNMSHPLIPDGWKMCGVVSDHCPVWAEFYCDRDVDKSADNANVDDILIKTKSS